MKRLTKTKVAIVYDRVNKWGGAERVLLSLHKLYPDAILYTSVYDRKNAPWAKSFPKVVPSFLQNIPFARSNHEFFAPLMPLVFGSFNFSDYDIVISVTSEAAKGIKTQGKTIHICYCLTPTRYLWSGYDFYFRKFPSQFNFIPFFRILAKPFIWFLRKWDIKVSKWPDKMIAISGEVRNRIKKYYKRDSQIIFPPVSIRSLSSGTLKLKRDYYLIVGRLIPYKRVDLAINVFNELGYKLYVVGSGSEELALKKIAGKNVKFFGQVTDSKLDELYSGAKALIMPQEEDFGIVSVEAQSRGVPVIAFKKGGALDTVIDGKTGVFFKFQNTKSLKEAILRFEKIRFKADNLLTNAKRFSDEKFRQNFARIVQNATKQRKF